MQQSTPIPSDNRLVNDLCRSLAVVVFFQYGLSIVTSMVYVSSCSGMDAVDCTIAYSMPAREVL